MYWKVVAGAAFSMFSKKKLEPLNHLVGYFHKFSSAFFEQGLKEALLKITTTIFWLHSELLIYSVCLKAEAGLLCGFKKKGR